MKNGVQIAIQVVFLVLFAFLVVSQRIQLWMGIFLASVILSIFFGRFYCGYICPINTLIKSITYIKKKLKIKNVKYPSFMQSNVTRYIVLIAFIGVFVFSARTGKKLPVLPVLVALGVFLSTIFHEELWHRYLCPYGTILSISSKKARKTMKIDSSKCNNCGVCMRVCPAKAVFKDSTSRRISGNDCLVCHECERNCKQGAISYTN